MLVSHNININRKWWFPNIFQRGRSTTNQFKDHKISISSTYSYVISPYIKDHIHIFHRVAWIIELDDGKIYRKTLYLMVKTMVSCRFSLKPIQWMEIRRKTSTRRWTASTRVRSAASSAASWTAAAPRSRAAGARRGNRGPGLGVLWNTWSWGLGVGGWILENGWKWWKIPGYNDVTWGLCVLFFSKSVGETRTCGTQHRSI